MTRQSLEVSIIGKVSPWQIAVKGPSERNIMQGNASLDPETSSISEEIRLSLKTERQTNE